MLQNKLIKSSGYFKEKHTSKFPQKTERNTIEVEVC